MFVSLILLVELRIPPLSSYLCYISITMLLENGKFYHELFIISLIVFLLCHIKKKKFYWERRGLQTLKSKNKKKKMKTIIYKENNFGFISEIKKKLIISLS